jgi:hypothetical protein
MGCERPRSLCIASAILTALLACGDRVPIPAQTPSRNLPTQLMLDRSVPVHGQVQVRGTTASIEAFDNFFAPTILAGSAGKAVLILLRNGGEHLHNFSLPGAGFDRDIPPGDIREARIYLPTTSDLVPFYCKYHRDTDSMIGAFRMAGG